MFIEPHKTAEADLKLLYSMGYAQELARTMKGFQNFAISFSIICIVSGGINSLGQGISGVGGAAIGIGWLLGCAASLVFALEASFATQAKFAIGITVVRPRRAQRHCQFGAVVGVGGLDHAVRLCAGHSRHGQGSSQRQCLPDRLQLDLAVADQKERQVQGDKETGEEVKDVLPHVEGLGCHEPRALGQCICQAALQPVTPGASRHMAAHILTDRSRLAEGSGVSRNAWSNPRLCAL